MPFPSSEPASDSDLSSIRDMIMCALDKGTAAGRELENMRAPAAELSPSPAWRALFPQVDAGVAGLWTLIIVSSLAVLPPFFYVVESSVTVSLPGFRTALGLENYQRV